MDAMAADVDHCRAVEKRKDSSAGVNEPASTPLHTLDLHHGLSPRPRPHTSC